MPEQVLQITDALTRGLRSSYEAPIDQQALVDCRAWRPSQDRLGAFRNVSDFIASGELSSNSITVEHPFPQIFVSRSFALLCDETRVFSIDLDTRALTEYNYYDVDTLEATTIDAGGVWHFADFGTGFFLFNGTNVLFLREGVLYVEKEIVIQSGCYHRGRMFFSGFDPSATWKKGWSWIMTQLLATDVSDYVKLAALSLEGLDTNTTWWSTIGGGDFYTFFYPEYAISGHFILSEKLSNQSFASASTGWTLSNLTHNTGGLVKTAGSLGTATQASGDMASAVSDGVSYLIKFKLSSLTSGTFKVAIGAVESDEYDEAGTHIAYIVAAADNASVVATFSAAAAGKLDWISVREVAQDDRDPLFLEHEELNQRGTWKADHEGTTLCVKPLGSHVILYGTNGVSALIHTAAPIPTYGERVLSRVGIADRGAVGGADNNHVFIDSDGKAWMLNADLQLSELGYEEYLQSLVGEPITVCYNFRENEYRISGRDAASLDSPKTPLPFVLTSSGMARSPEVVTTGMWLDGEFAGLAEASEVEIEALIESGVFDLGTSLLKHLRRMEFSYLGGGTLSAALKYRTDHSLSFVQTDWVTVSKTGICNIPVSCVQFAFLFKVSDYAQVQKLDKVSITYDLVGRVKASNVFSAA